MIRTHADRWSISGPLRFAGSFAPPADKSLAHRAFLLAALSRGRCVLRNVPAAEDVQRTRAALQELGIEMHVDGDACTVEGVGLRGLRPAGRALDCGNSGTTMRLLVGVLALQRFASELRGDASLSKRPMRRVAEPLRAMGAAVVCDGADERPPLHVGPAPLEGLRGRAHRLAVDSAQVRSAILLAGLGAVGRTTVHPASAARDHTERMLGALGVDVRTDGEGTTLTPVPGAWDGFRFDIPGDPSALAFFAGRAESLQAHGVGLNPGRVRYLEILREAGVVVEMHPQDTVLGEPRGRVGVAGVPRRPLGLGGVDAVRCIDEIPALLAAAAAAGVEARVDDVGELRVKESDRIATMARVLRAFGASVHEGEDHLHVEAGARLRAATVQTHGDHRVAMAAAILAAAAPGPSVIEDVGCVGTSYPGFAADFTHLARPA